MEAHPSVEDTTSLGGLPDTYSSSLMFVTPSSVTRLPPRLPSMDHRLTIPEHPKLARRRPHTAIGTLSPAHTSRPLRSSPLAGPSIAASHDGTLFGAASAPPTLGGGSKHLSPLAEFSSTAAEVVDAADSKKHRRRSLGNVLSKISFPNPPSSLSSGSDPDHSFPGESVNKTRRRAKSMSSPAPPPIPPMPVWAQKSLPSSNAASHNRSPSSPRSLVHSHTSPTTGSPRSSRPGSPTPSTRSTASRKSIIQLDPRTMVPMRIPPSTSPNPEENWLTQSAVPRFSRVNLKAQGVIMPVSARDARRRSTAVQQAKSLEKLPPPRPIHTRNHSRSSTMSSSSISSSASPAIPSHFRSRASSIISASSGSHSVDCYTPSLSMSAATSTSDVSSSSLVTADEMGVLPGSVQIRLNDVPVGVIDMPPDAYQGLHFMDKGNGKGRDYGTATVHVRAATDSSGASVASVGSIGSLVSVGSGNYAAPWMRPPASPVGSEQSSLAGSTVSELNVGSPVHGPDPARHERSATAPESHTELAEKKRTRTRSGIGRVWKQVVRSVTIRR